MSGRPPQALPLVSVLGALAVLAMFAASGAARAADSLRIALEPGVVAADGSGLLPLRITEPSGRLRPARDAALALEIEGLPAEFEVVRPPQSLAVLVDPSAIPAGERAAWAEALEKSLTEVGADASGSPARLYFGGDRLVEVAPARGEIVAALERGTPVRLFDGIVEAVSRSSVRPGLERHALLVIASGVESKESRHPLVSCIGAADTARVAVHAIVVPAAERAAAGESRLRELAAKSGGLARLAGGGPGGTLQTAFARMRDGEALRIPHVPGNPGERRVVRVLAPDAAPAAGILARRSPLEFAGGRPFPWMPIAAGVLLVAGAAWLLASRTRPLGRLVVLSGAPARDVPITSHGVTLGGAKGNRLVFEDSRVSRNHAVVQVRGGDVTLVDLKSTNGTMVNGKRVTTKVLEAGDRILLAEAVELVYEERRMSRRGGGGATRSPSNAPKNPPAKRQGPNDVDEDDE